MRAAWVIIAGLAWLGGCAAPIKDSATDTSVPATARVGANPPDLRNAVRQPSAERGDGLAPTPDRLNPEPDAVVTLDPKTGALTPAMDARLASIADELTRNERLLVRLESYVPSGGSPALEIGIADRTLRKVREHLVSQGVSPRRMLFGSFGGEHGKERDSLRHWVELYLVRTGY